MRPAHIYATLTPTQHNDLITALTTDSGTGTDHPDTELTETDCMFWQSGWVG
jgi:hypothetical protein